MSRQIQLSEAHFGVGVNDNSRLRQRWVAAVKWPGVVVQGARGCCWPNAHES